MVNQHANNGELSDNEVTRVAMRIAMTAFSELERDSGDLDDAEVLKKYILLCPYVPPGCPAISAVMETLDNFVPPETNKNASTNKWKTATDDIRAPQSPKQKKVKTRDFIAIDAAKPDAWVAPKKQRFSVLWLIRNSLIYATLFAVFALYFGIIWMHRLHDLYLHPQMQALVWTEDRAFQEMTYFARQCDRNDMTTLAASDLTLPEDATPEEAYQHQLLHGLTLFPKILTEETATALRNFVISKNRNLTDDESIFVIENENRFSFGLGTEEPSVTNAMMEIGRNKRLVDGMEKILGKDPALIEMTAITSSYGAVDQYWHDDVISSASVLKFGRSFAPSYSVFIQLQNTTKEMGATSVCPGTYMCPHGKMETYCDKYGFQVVDSDGYWKTGDALLMNMNTWHRGAAHVDPNAMDRVMLILSFVPKPQTRAESRQMSQGITFSLRWDMWGHTMQDLANAKTAMGQPWATLRALGLYKAPGASWGIDYISGSSMRIANGDNGFRRDELDTFIERGGFKLLPKFLHGEVSDEESWYEYYLDTLLRCEKFIKKINLYVVMGYVALQVLVMIIGMLMSRRGRVKRRPVRAFVGSLVGLGVTYYLTFSLYLMAVRHVDNTHWAEDIRAGRLYTSPYSGSEEETYFGPTTMPYRNDVLIETRYGSEYLSMYNDFVMGHPGNRAWARWLERASALYPSYGGLPPIFRRALAEQVVGVMETSSRRFLYQNPQSHWVWMSRQDAVRHTSAEIASRSNDVLHHTLTQLRYLFSECKYGRHRLSTMSDVDIIPMLGALESRLMEQYGYSADTGAEPNNNLARPSDLEVRVQRKPFRRLFDLEKPHCQSKFQRRPVDLAVGVLPGEPKRGVWLKEGDVIEGKYREEDGRAYWYMGTISLVSSFGEYVVTFFDGDTLYLYGNSIRQYKQLIAGDPVEILDERENVYHKAQILREMQDGTFLVYLKQSGQRISGVNRGLFRRGA